MPKKSGKGKKAKGKSGGGTAKKAPTVQDTVLTIVTVNRTPGHQVEDVVKGEGEGVTTESLAPGTATNVPSAAPPQVTETPETTETGDSSTEAAEAAEEPSSPGTAKTFPLTRPEPVDGDGTELRMPTSLPDSRETAVPEGTHTLEDAVDKTQASKAGLVGSLDGGESEGQAVLPETTAKESKLTAATTIPETAAPTPVVITDANAPVSEPVVTGETVGAAGTTGLAEKAAEGERAETGAIPTTLPERPKAKDTIEAASPSESVDSVGHAKRPYESSLFHKEEDHKPPKMPKVEEDLDAASAAKTSEAAPAVPTETEVPGEQKGEPLIVPGLGAEPSDKPFSDVEVSGFTAGQKATEPVTPAAEAAPSAPATTAPIGAETVTEPTPTVPGSTAESRTAEALAPTAAPTAAETAAATTSPAAPAAAAVGEDKQRKEIQETIQSFTEQRQAPAAKELQQQHQDKVQEKILETAPAKVTPETPTKAQPSVAAAAAAAAMRNKSAAAPSQATPSGVSGAETAGKAEERVQPESKVVAQEPTEGAAGKAQPETQQQVPTEAQAEPEAAVKDTQAQQEPTAAAKKSHEEAQTAVDQAQEAQRAEAARAEKRKSGLWSWLKRKVKGA
ncbi:uncharacterized protein ACLA_086790 [Aspergillus clavatus NRRL 1]|uniref:Uncharacterized protein n=1 Tax=Aspergillus clavatus (strain ATCC 1007 / CBS 513.65 / DSM 816 / NCTC 3887 / NRRL 1 / QM 1276 / 107) TaxID=344612 RepID=A1CUJ1_ASPCL|nr:uncharacterized protein ACLA_086790 [Aspergillus clavatus NRRL 1]EAW06978.1 conserved hypothetical protein [Aspergillus clavatus NRRL 1]